MTEDALFGVTEDALSGVTQGHELNSSQWEESTMAEKETAPGKGDKSDEKA